jgi:phosphatidylserine decarboxylase
MSRVIHSFSQQEQLNFLLTNRIPRRLATQFIGWLSRIENPLLTRNLILLWQLFSDDLKLEEARKQEFSSLQDCFTRELREGARQIDTRENIVVSPCDAIIGAFGNIEGTTVFQAKGFPYDLEDLIPERMTRERYRDGRFITLRLKSSMYHRFHAPIAGHIGNITYVSGDTWNVNPVALKRIEKLYCKNERAVMELVPDRPFSRLCLVPVAAILVASIKLNWLQEPLDIRYEGPENIRCDVDFIKGDELGYFQHGSTIILFATPDHTFCEDIETGRQVQMGQALMSFAGQAGGERTANVHQTIGGTP